MQLDFYYSLEKTVITVRKKNQVKTYHSLNNFIIPNIGITKDLQTLTASAKGDSESDLQDQTPDTDDSGAHSYPEISMASSLGGGAITGSFKRAPIMGNRAVGQRTGKRTKTKETPPVS